MSADSYAKCPACTAALETIKREWEEQREQDYGTLSLKEFEAKYRSQAPTVKLNLTLAEDFDIGMDTRGEGVFSVSYSCRCTVCGWSWKFSREPFTLCLTQQEIDDSVRGLTRKESR